MKLFFGYCDGKNQQLITSICRNNQKKREWRAEKGAQKKIKKEQMKNSLTPLIYDGKEYYPPNLLE